MKKLFTLLTLALLSIGTAWAGDVFTVDFNGGGKTQSTADYFTITGSTNNNYKTGKYNGTSYTHALKMESSTKVTFTNAATATLRIIQATEKNGSAQTKGLKIDGTAYAYNAACVTTPSDANNQNIRVYTITDLEASSHTIERDGGESGVYRIEVEYTGVVLTKLSTPAISFNATTGEVTIGAVANATKVTYTTNGSIPTASSDTYSSPFDVADGTVVKAIAIGDGVSYSNSDVATENVLLTGITIADPVVKQSNGTVAITCASPSSTIEYSLDGGSNWTAYSRAFTLTANTDIKARASRSGCTTSSVVDETITAVPANVKTKTIVMGYGAFEGSGKVLTGKAEDVAAGYTLNLITDQDKSFSGRNKIDISSIGAQRTTILGSNGAQCRLDLPTGVKATKLTLYSYVNSAKDATKSGWKEVNGDDLQSVVDNVPMGAFTDLADYQSNPDVRIFPLDNVVGSITFNNAGTQLCFVIELDVIEPNVTATVDATTGWSTFVSSVPLDFTGISDVNAYIVTGHTGSAINVTPMTATVPANTPLLLEGTTTAIPVVASSSTDVSDNKLKSGTGAAVSAEGGKTKYVLAADGATAVFKKIGATDATVPVGKAYLEFNEEISAPALSLELNGDVTGIDAIQKQTVSGEFYNLNGQRVAQPTKGLYIVNGKKVVIK